jgi:hypothetical protein
VASFSREAGLGKSMGVLVLVSRGNGGLLTSGPRSVAVLSMLPASGSMSAMALSVLMAPPALGSTLAVAFSMSTVLPASVSTPAVAFSMLTALPALTSRSAVALSTSMVLLASLVSLSTPWALDSRSAVRSLRLPASVSTSLMGLSTLFVGDVAAAAVAGAVFIGVVPAVWRAVVVHAVFLHVLAAVGVVVVLAAVGGAVVACTVFIGVVVVPFTASAYEAAPLPRRARLGAVAAGAGGSTTPPFRGRCGGATVVLLALSARSTLISISS